MTVDTTALQTAVQWGCARSLAGKSFCLTGAMSLTRTDMELVINALGGTAQNSVRNSTDYLVVPEADGFRKGSKFKAAQAQGKIVITEEEFCELILPSLDELQAAV